MVLVPEITWSGSNLRARLFSKFTHEPPGIYRHESDGCVSLPVWLYRLAWLVIELRRLGCERFDGRRGPSWSCRGRGRAYLAMGASEDVSGMWPCGMLRFLQEQTCHQAFSCSPASPDAFRRTRRSLGVVLCGSDSCWGNSGLSTYADHPQRCSPHALQPVLRIYSNRWIIGCHPAL